MVVFSFAPARHGWSYGTSFPQISRLLTSGRWYETATSVSPIVCDTDAFWLTSGPLTGSETARGAAVTRASASAPAVIHRCRVMSSTSSRRDSTAYVATSRPRSGFTRGDERDRGA